MLQRLYDLLYEFKEYTIFAGLLIVCLMLMALNDNAQVKYVRSLATVTFGVFENQFSFIPSYFGLRAENELLRRVNMELADESQRLREAKLENLRLHQLLSMREQFPNRLIAARVVNKNLLLMRNTVTLNIGTADGVAMHMPVVSDEGLVGSIIAVTPHFSIVNILYNSDFRASAKIQRSRVDGILSCEGHMLLLKNVPKTRDVKIGDVVMTSEYSSMFPEGIRIGLVDDVKDETSSLFKTITLSPGVDFVKLEELFVIQYKPDQERMDLEQSANQRAGK
ncbi:MAG TPA: rod shape-determining protein MreC [Bacteroidota bacterium]|nr:rod shape-determining protein MreC [Bacteroidota bacterium]